MHNFDIGDLVLIVDISCFADLREPDAGKFGIIVGTYFDWVVRSDILYIHVENKRKGFYVHEVELIAKND